MYDRLGLAGEEMLPYYRYMIIHADLYTVHGGFVNWLAEGLGIVSFTNELWNDAWPDHIDARACSRPAAADDAAGRTSAAAVDAALAAIPSSRRPACAGRTACSSARRFTDYTEFDHPTLGKVLIGGGTKWSSRIPPPFMLEEECHRNFAFTMFHADNMPLIEFNWIEVKPLGATCGRSPSKSKTTRSFPTRTAWAAHKKIGMPDR